MESLTAADRSAILLRYFENKSLRDVGRTLGTSEDAAQKRVSRALDQLRTFFSRRGVTVGAALLAADLSAGAVLPAPIGLGLTVASATAVAGVGGAAVAAGAVRIFTMTSIQKTLIGTTLVAILGAGIYGRHVLEQQAGELPRLREQTARLEAENRQLRRDRADDARLLRDAQNAIDAVRVEAPVPARAAAGGDPVMEAELKSVLARVIVLKQQMADNPGHRIPELGFLKDQDWINAAARHKLGTDKDLQAALADVRASAKVDFSELMAKALWQYARANDGQIPPDVSLLAPYFDPAVPTDALRRYGIMRAGKLSAVPPETIVIAETAPPDDNRDPRLYMAGPRTAATQNNITIHSGSFADDVTSAVLTAVAAYTRENVGMQPADPAQLVPYLPAPVDSSRLLGFWKALGLPADFHRPND